jgi:Tfp pilus assembly major pilin PilA
MRTRRIIQAVLTIALIAPAIPAHAFDWTLPRDQQVTYIANTYMPAFDNELARIKAIKAKMYSDTGYKAQYDAFFADYSNSRKTIEDALASSTADLKTTEDFAIEETGEFDNTVYLLEQMAKNIKSISCVKGKTTKAVMGLKPVCPKGYRKKI